MFSAGFYRVLVQKSLDVLVSDVFLRKRKSAVMKQIVCGLEFLIWVLLPELDY